MTRFAVIVIVSLTIIVPVLACEDAGSVLSEYLARDLRGERLSHEMSVSIDKLEAGGEFEPAWDVVTLTTGYEIKEIRRNGQAAIATVLFTKTWVLDDRAVPNPGAMQDEAVEVHLVKQGGCWKIAAPFYQPHVQADSQLKQLSDLLERAMRSGADKDYVARTTAARDAVLSYKEAVRSGERKRD